jgi:hypothetical protein
MDIVNQAFKKLLQAKTIDDVDRILDDLNVDKKYRIAEQLYPEIKFKITEKEILELKSKKIVSDENFVSNVPNSDALSKLLYALAWKNGDLLKLKHIIEGIIGGDEDTKENGLVFYQFGKHLSNESVEPIIDQNVLRAFGIYLANGDNSKIDRLKRLSLITKKEKKLIAEYKTWLKSDLTQELRDTPQYSNHVDKVLFALGKFVKNRERIQKDSISL